ncbi:hypothetical protein Lal_00027184 [Lupinus albus]|uniref:Putative Galactose-binding domain, SUN domain-containing protein n=1 Tax=Lupinus albus TaxID=3870 RepID=A0A6A5P9Z2_LUPAL|nr:putative Galactose-binding domain, SUN domain-containing protein [Lupinus albus]KAF1894336.1 hypothetical protein Lal_00027184 [Lupinus albus]
MQRSRKALLERKAMEKASNGRNYLYKVSLSLVLVLLGVIFLFSLWISGGGHGNRDGSEEFSVVVSNQKKDNHTMYRNSNYADEYFTTETDAYIPSEPFCSNGAKVDFFVRESLLSGVILDYAEPIDDKVSYNSRVREGHEVERSESISKDDNDVQKYDHLSQAVPLGLGEFKSREIGSKINSRIGSSVNVIHRLESSGAEYNYASASNGAKIVASNKEAKGASNILTRDKDKYLRNPCSSEHKFVIIDLSEETLVDKIKIANLEHYSSNFKDFELHGSLIYPTEKWVFLGNFTASNVKQVQMFVLEEKKWVRYLNLNLQSHYGSEFYCTLSIVEVYGVDAIERMLEDLINTKDNPNYDDNVWKNGLRTINLNHASEISWTKQENVNRNVPIQVGRMQGDTVLKILMQKVHFLDINLFVLEQYLEDLNSRYVNNFNVYSEEIEEKDMLIQKTKEDIRSFNHRDVIMKDARDFDSWKSHISMQLDDILNDNSVSRSEFEKVQENQASLENKCKVVFCICVIFSLLVILRLFLVIAISICALL